MVKQGMYSRVRAVCEFCDSKHGYKDDLCELKLNDVEVNESVETAQATTIKQILDEMKYERRLILAIVLKSSNNNVKFNELRCKYRRFEAEGDEDKSLEA